MQLVPRLDMQSRLGNSSHSHHPAHQQAEAEGIAGAGGGEHERMQLPPLDEGLALTPCCLAAASQERIVLATAEGTPA